MAHLKMGALVILFVLVLCTDSFAKAWRGITPLKSTRADVERVFGKPNDQGRYEIENERAYVFYSEGPCTDGDPKRAPQRCECLAAKDIVLRITMTLETFVKFQGFGNRDFTRAPLRSKPSLATYSDRNEGIVYTVDDSAGMLTAIDYWPSSSDCKDLIKRHSATAERNVWRGIRPLYSTRKDVERILGRPKRQSLNQAYVYQTSDENVDVLYSEGACSPSVVGKWNVATDTVLKVTVYPHRVIMMGEWGLSLAKYHRSLDPNIPNWYFWTNRAEGILIQSQLQHGVEQIMAIEYSRSDADMELLCK